MSLQSTPLTEKIESIRLKRVRGRLVNNQCFGYCQLDAEWMEETSRAETSDCTSAPPSCINPRIQENDTKSPEPQRRNGSRSSVSSRGGGGGGLLWGSVFFFQLELGL